MIREKLDCPKKEPPIDSPDVPDSELEKAVPLPLKLISPHLWQYPGAPNLQLWHCLQNENDRRTLSPAWTVVTFGPVDLTMPAPIRNVVSRKVSHTSTRD